MNVFVRNIIQNWRQSARQLKAETYALYLAYWDPRTPWYARVWSMCVVTYAFSPIDLIPDFIPVLGYLDDLVLVPLGIAFAIKLIPPDVLDESRKKAQLEMEREKPANWIAAIAIVIIWILAAVLLVIVAARLFGY